MSKINMLNINGEKVKEIKLNDNVWNIEPNDSVIHDAVVRKLASVRQGSHATKTRSEVSGGGRKPWRQKGTGNARQGSIRAPQWRGGGIVFGPQPNRNYERKMNKKERRLALKSALSYKFKDNELMVIENIDFSTNKTKEMLSLLNKLELTNKKVLLVMEELNENVCLSSRNLGNVKIELPNEVNTYDVLNADVMLMTNASLQKLEEVISGE